MKKLVLSILVICVLSLPSMSQSDLIIVVEGVRNEEGTIRVGLFTDAEHFPDSADIGETTTISGSKGTVVFKGLKPGRYAVAIIHDENNNGKFDTNAIGLPQEGFAFGNNAIGMFGPPSFRKASIAVEEKTLTQKIRLRYF